MHVHQRVSADGVPTACLFCGGGAQPAGEESLKRCGRCKGAYYCGRECQTRHWPLHKTECSCVGEVVRVTTRASSIHSRGLFAAIAMRVGEVVYEDGFLGEELPQPPAADAPPPPAQILYVNIVTAMQTAWPALLDLLPEPNAPLTNRVAHAYVRPIFWFAGILPVIMLVNHSCDPNCEVREDPGRRTAKLVALRDLAAGEELTIRYGTAEEISAGRLGFTCSCPICRPAELERSMRLMTEIITDPNLLLQHDGGIRYGRGREGVSFRLKFNWCSLCGAGSEPDSAPVKLMKCSMCRNVLYCSRDCQQKDWREHKKKCKDLAARLKEEEAAFKYKGSSSSRDEGGSSKDEGSSSRG